MMNSSSPDVDRIRRRRMSSFTSGSWLLVAGTLALLALGASARPSDELYDGFGAEEYADVDNVEWHHVKIVDGVMQPEDHPVIFYKEDFVSEDYDPSKDKHKNATEPKARPHHSRKYKEISRRHRLNRTEAEKYRALKPEKIYFDVLPQAPVVVADDSGANDSKFDASKIRVEVMSLADDEPTGDEVSKQLLSKRPKKYRRRQRRDTGPDAIATTPEQGEGRNHKKRNAYYVQDSVNPVLAFFQSIYGTNLQQPTQKSNPVRGNYWNPLSLPGPQAVPVKPPTTQIVPTDFVPRFGDENEQDRVVWGSKTLVTKRPYKATLPPLFRDPHPNNIDTSFLTTRPPTSSRPQQANRRPQQTTRRPLPPLFYDPDPENADLSFLTRPNSNRSPASGVTTTTTTTTTTPRPPLTTASPEEPEDPPEPYIAQISDCVWAIVQCCSRRDFNIRYQCFESMGCYGAFWDLNPCADHIQDNAINYINDFLN